MKDSIFILLFLFLFSSCGLDHDDLYGTWVNKVDSPSKESYINALVLSESQAITIDHFGVKNYFDFEISNNQLVLKDSIESWPFLIEQKNEDKILLDSFPFEKLKKITENFPFGIDLVNLRKGAKSLNNGKGTYSIVSVKKDKNEEFVLKLGDKITTIKDLVYFRPSKSHHSRINSVILLTDRNIRYKDLLPIYFYFKVMGIRKISFATSSTFPQFYKGFNDKPHIWAEDLELFQAQMNTPPPPPVMSRKYFFELNKKIKQITLTSVSEFKIFLGKIRKAEVYLINLEGNLSIREYVEIKLLSNEFLDNKKDEMSEKEFGLKYAELPIEKKKLIRSKGPFILFEMRYID